MKPIAFGIAILAAGSTGHATPAHSLAVGAFQSDPIGFHDAAPPLSWKLPEGEMGQTEYRIQISTNGKTFDSEWVESEQSVFVPFPGEALQSREIATWRVNLKNEKGEALGWSEEASIEMGLLSNADWSAKWIRPNQPIDPVAEEVAWLRKNFQTRSSIEKARLHVTARGVFELQLNGKGVAEDYFANGWTPYDERLDTLTYDVTDQLIQFATNELVAKLGTGWYAGRLPFETKERGPYGKQPELLLQLEISYRDGSVETVVSDESWQGTYEGPILASSFYDGETYDARRLPRNWQAVVANSELGPAKLQPKPFAPIRKVDELIPNSINEVEPGRYVFDLGQNMVGLARIRIPIKVGETVTLRFAEMLLPDGSLYTENYRTAKSTETYIAANEGLIEWEPSFTFHGFRYVELSGLPPGSVPKADWVTGIVLQTPLQSIGSFECSLPKLNQLQSNIRWGWIGNSLDIPTDCPQRDERAGWTGDAQVFAPTALFLTDSLAFWKSWLQSMRMEQDENGVIPDIVPTARKKWRNLGPGWMDAATFIPWEAYIRTGDKSVLSDNYAMMIQLVDWYRSQSNDGLIRQMSKGYGDWLQPHQITPPDPKKNMSDRMGDTDFAYLGNAFYARSLQILANTAATLRKTEEATQYSAEAEALREKFRDRYFSPDGKLLLPIETQTAYALAISFNLLPAELEKKAGQHLSRLVEQSNGNLRTGFLGTPHLIPALDKTGHSELAFSILTKETYPSWFYSINQGATTMWERWNSYSHEDGFGDASMNSFNHYAYGAIGQWMYERLAGLAPDPETPGYKHFFIRPLTDIPLDSAKAELETPYGTISCSWIRADDGSVTLSAMVPPNTTATLAMPDTSTQNLAPGSHRIKL